MKEKIPVVALSDSLTDDTVLVVTLIYMDNVNRVTVGTIEVKRSISIEEFTKEVIDTFVSHGYVEPTIDDLHILTNEWRSFDPDYLLGETQATIVYSRVIALNNAYEICRKDGLVYYINTSEKPHLEYPHVHVKCSGEEISISLTDFAITGSFKSNSKKRIAKKFVEKKHDDMLKEWHRIINNN